MKSSLRFARVAVASFALLAGLGPAKGNGFDLNHYILACTDTGVCPFFSGPVIVSGGGIDATFTGSWYDPAQSGHGIFLEVLPDHRMMAFWFTFNPAGTQQAWLAGVGTFAGNVATFDSVTMPTGGQWIPNFDATKVVDNAWGTMKLTFDDANNGKVEFASTLGFGIGSMKLSRLTRIAGVTTRAVESVGQWVPTRGFVVFVVPPLQPTLVALTDGSVLAVGGGVVDTDFGENSVPVWDVQRYDPAKGSWSIDSSTHAGYFGAPTATLLQDGRVLVVGQSTDTSGVELYDPNTRTWTAEPGPNSSGHTATLLRNGKVLVVGCGAVLYDPATHSWSAAGSPAVCRDSHQATLLPDGRVLVTGGVAHVSSYPSYHAETTASAEIFDPVAGTWTATGSLRSARASFTATLLPSGKVLAVGGVSNTAPDLVEAELFDPATGAWASAGSPRAGRWAHTATLLPTAEVLVAGGYLVGQPTESTEIYHPDDGTWREATPMLAPLEGHSAIVLGNGSVLVGQQLLEAATPGTISPGMTGAWFDPRQNGHGIVVEVLPGGQVLARWFAFNPAGTEQTWFGGVGSYMGNTATIFAYQPTGGRFIPNFDPAKIVNETWGWLTFTFTDCDAGKVDFRWVDGTGGYDTGSMSLTRLTQPAGVSCP